VTNVLLTAAPRARRWARPELISGVIVTLTPKAEQAGIVHVALANLKDVPENEIPPGLVGKPTKQTYRGLTVWEVDVETAE
jgi:hypothetical protein